MEWYLHHHLRLAVSMEGVPLPMREALGARFRPVGKSPLPADLTLRLICSPRIDAPRGQAIFFHDEVRGFAEGAGVILSDGRSTLRVCPKERTITGTIHPESAAAPEHFINLLFFIALAVAMRSHHLFHLHAGAVIHPGGAGALIIGESGAGKTTTSLALLYAGWAFLGDDAVWLTRQAEAIQALRASREFHLTPRTARIFPGLRPHLRRRGSGEAGKWSVRPEEPFPGLRRRQVQDPAYLIFPQIAGRPRSTVDVMPQAEAFYRLIRSSALLVVDGMPGRREQFSHLSELLRRTTHLRLALGEDALDDPSIPGVLLEPHLGGG